MFLPSAPIFGHLLRYENLEVGDYVVGFRRLASTQNLTHESYRLRNSICSFSFVHVYRWRPCFSLLFA